MPAVAAFKRKILSVGEVSVFRMAFTTNTIGDPAQYPFPDELPEDRFFRVFFNWRILWRQAAGASDSAFSMSLLTDTDSQSVWQRRVSSFAGATGPTFSKDNLSADEHWAGSLDIQSYFHPDNIVYPPGLAIRVGITSGNAGSQIDTRCLMAESPDPKDLWPFVGARTGGISGLR